MYLLPIHTEVPGPLAVRKDGRSRWGFTLIELLVVIGIAAMLLTMATTQFFGAMRRESTTKSRNQLRDLLLTARQQACILGTTHILICWNANATVTVGDKTKTDGKQGRYALFQYVGDVWKKGSKLYTPFGVQSEQLASLKHGARAVSLADPSATKFARITDVVRSPSKTDEKVEEELRNKTANIDMAYMVGGEKVTGQWSVPMYPVADFSGSLQDLENGRVPLAIRTSSTLSLPQYYAFDKDRLVFIFTPDGCLDASSDKSITAKHSLASSAKNVTIGLSVNDDGTVKLEK